jgi:signal transduction histidine kinase
VTKDGWLQKGTVYLALSVIIVGAYALVVAGLSLALGTATMISTPIWAGALTFVLALLFNPLRARLREMVDRSLFVGKREYAEALGEFDQELAGAYDLAALRHAAQRLLSNTLSPDPIHLFVYDSLGDQYAAVPGDDGRPSTDVCFPAKSALPGYIAANTRPLHLMGSPLPSALRTDQARLTLLGSGWFMRLAGRERLAGWLAVGPRLLGKPYSPGDVDFLQGVADRIAGAVQRVQATEELGRRMREMDALSRMAQGVNITVAFDDALELLYAQTAQVLPLSDFHITLYDRERDRFQTIFAVENKERVAEREGLSTAGDAGLVPLVVENGQPILTQDYTGECRSRGVLPVEEGPSAWIGVPMNSGAESIGALSIARRDPMGMYTSGHLGLLQAIADQATGAIVKARLLQESQERAHQLTRLNDISRQFASTLEMEPLVHQIVAGAASVMGCETSVLYLTDPATKELVIRAVAGSLSENPVGRRFAAGPGLVGRAASTGAPVIENSVPAEAQDELGLAGLGLARLSAIAAPLQAQERNIGVLLVVNRRDGLPFAGQERTLLMALAGQAAVAAENVRLYMSTDQELAARVEELSAMQRIDRELNDTLDIERAMRITLDWALRQTNADAGLVGMLEEGHLRVVAQAGYGQALGATTGPTLPLTRTGFQAAVDSALPQQVDLTAAGARGLLPGSDHQTVVPIRREAAVIGLLVLEGSGGAHEDLAFLSRLSDHAAIAIANARLFDQVQRANASKSEFISLVAHELKNPMTSIKGYAELLAAGTVGPITEMQAGFLDTIRTNTERMSTLISDLNDNSKIEAGQLRLEFKSVDLGQLIDESFRSSQRQIEEKEQTVQRELPAGLPRVWADETRIIQVLTNLISNANKYTPEGGVIIIGAEAAHNRWDADGPSEVVHVWLRDDGIGISEAEQPQVFQKFFRSEDPRAREVPGAGLGLNITRSLVELQGGHIWFDSQYSRGTTFHFTVPVAEA